LENAFVTACNQKGWTNQYQGPQLVCYANPRIGGLIRAEHANSLEILFTTREN